jgi:hypothetical protein
MTREDLLRESSKQDDCLELQLNGILTTKSVTWIGKKLLLLNPGPGRFK